LFQAFKDERSGLASYRSNKMLYRFYHAIRDIVRANCTSGPSPSDPRVDRHIERRAKIIIGVISCLKSSCFIFGIYEDISFEVAYPYIILTSSLCYRPETIIPWARHLRLIRHYIVSILEPLMMPFWFH